MDSGTQQEAGAAAGHGRGLEGIYLSILKKIPGVSGPKRKLTFKEKLKWTGLILIIYFVMTQVMLFGISTAGLDRFKTFEILLGSTFGSLMSLGIGPIVTASIILQLLVGSKLIPWNLRDEKGRMLFQGTQKLLAVLFSFVEGGIYVFMGAVPASDPSLVWIVLLQLAMGGILVIFMDELISKWGFGSGVSLFIAAGVGKTIIVRMFSPFTQAGGFPGPGTPPSGAIPYAVTAVAAGEMINAFIAMLPVIATVVVFFIVIYTNAIRIEIPLAFGNIRGFGRRWPLKLFYTSNIPVILVAALLANVQLIGRIAADKGATWIGTFDASGNPTGGLIMFFIPPSLGTTSGLFIAQMMIIIGVMALLGAFLANILKKSPVKVVTAMSILGAVAYLAAIYSTGLSSLVSVEMFDVGRMIVYSLFLIVGSAIFSMFWVSTSGMDSTAVAEQIEGTGMQIPGFRRDTRITERVLDRYIPALAILGGALVGALAAYADLTGALGTGTGLLLATMIIYNLYEQLAAQHMEDMHPALRRIMGQ
jgi:preprotein translocase subunit SecY